MEGGAMARLHFTVYRNSGLATVISIIGSLIFYMGLLMMIISILSLFGGGAENFFGVILSGAVMIGIGIGLAILASNIAEKASHKNAAEYTEQKSEEEKIKDSVAVHEKRMKIMALGFVVVTALFFVFLLVVMT